MIDTDAEELRELQDPESWAWDTAVVMPPVPDAGAVVAVRFAGEDFKRIAREAEAAGMRLTEFIRQGALEKAARGALR